MEYVRSVIVHPGTIWGFVAVLMIWALWSAVQARRATMRLTRSLDQAQIRIGQETDALQFAEDFESVSSDLLKLPYVRQRWRQYRETLVIPTTPGRPIRAPPRTRSNGSTCRYARTPAWGSVIMRHYQTSSWHWQINCC